MLFLFFCKIIFLFFKKQLDCRDWSPGHCRDWSPLNGTNMTTWIAYHEMSAPQLTTFSIGQWDPCTWTWASTDSEDTVSCVSLLSALLPLLICVFMGRWKQLDLGNFPMASWSMTDKLNLIYRSKCTIYQHQTKVDCLGIWSTWV